ncbi:MAG: hypothetical protein ABJN01_10070 [Sulfitobacter sp.]
MDFSKKKYLISSGLSVPGECAVRTSFCAMKLVPLSFSGTFQSSSMEHLKQLFFNNKNDPVPSCQIDGHLRIPCGFTEVFPTTTAPEC